MQCMIALLTSCLPLPLFPGLPDDAEAVGPDKDFGANLPPSALWRAIVEVRAARDLLPATGKLKAGW